MVPEQKKYPAVANDISNKWTNDSYATGQEDNFCANTNSSQVCNYYLQVKTYGFNIPVGATITGVFMVVKQRRYRNCAVGSLTFYMIPPSRFGRPNQVITAPCDASPPADKCSASAVSSELDLTSLGSWLSSDFNNETFETWFRHTGDNLLMESWCDAAYLRVTYTEPTAPTPSGDGLVWVTQ